VHERGAAGVRLPSFFVPAMKNERGRNPSRMVTPIADPEMV
jgi:hypothetical protein